MGNYFLTKKALEDLTDIWNYTFDEWSEVQADKYYFELLEACNQLSDNQNWGRKYDEISSEIFGFNKGRHIIFYKKKNKTQIEIIRFLHVSMDLKNHITLN
jgi:toxin ParE1/3/4